MEPVVLFYVFLSTITQLERVTWCFLESYLLLPICTWRSIKSHLQIPMEFTSVLRELYYYNYFLSISLSEILGRNDIRQKMAKTPLFNPTHFEMTRIYP